MKYTKIYTVLKLEYDKFKLSSLLNENMAVFFFNENFRLEVREELDKEIIEQIRIGLAR